MKAVFLIVNLLFVAATFAAERPMDKQLRLFAQYIQGEFDNYNQVNFETNGFLSEKDIPDDKHARLYKRVVRLELPDLGEHVFYEQTHAGGRDKPIYRQTLVIVTPNHERQQVIATNYRLRDAKRFANPWEHAEKAVITGQDIYTVGEQCETEYQLIGESFIGEIDATRCKVASKHGGDVFVGGQFVLSAQGYWHLEEGFKQDGTRTFGREDGQYYRLARAESFQCWAAFKTDKNKDDGEPRWDFFPQIRLHNQGDIARFTTTHTVPEHYFIRLKETIFPSGNRPDVLEIFVHEDTEKAHKNYKQALSYTWTNADADRLGLNLRWMQASCKRL